MFNSKLFRQISLLFCLSAGLLIAQLINAQQPWPIVVEAEAQYSSHASIQLIAWNPQGSVLGVATDDGLLLLDSALQPVTILYSGDLIRAFSWSPNGQQLILTRNRQLEIWQWNDTARILTFDRLLAAADLPYAVAWSPDGQHIVSLNLHQDPTYYDWIGTFNVWSSVTWALERSIGAETSRYVFQPLDVSIEGGAPTAQRMAWATNGNPLIAVVGSLNPTQNGAIPGEPISVYLLNVETGVEAGILPLITNELGNAIAWQPGGDLVAVADSYGAVVYRLSDGESVASLINASQTFTVAWDPSGDYVVAGTLLFRVTPEQRLGEFGNNWGAKIAVWHPSGAFITLVTGDNTISNRNPMNLPSYTPGAGS